MDKAFICLFTLWVVVFSLQSVAGTKEEEPVVIPPGLEVHYVSPISIVTERDQDVTLNCSIDYNPELGPPSIEWTKNGIPVEINKRIQLLENGSLLIKHIKYNQSKQQKSDDGHYRCFATLKKMGTVILSDVHIKVADIGKFDIEPKPQAVPAGGVARFHCSIKAVPTASYIWQRNKSPLPHDSRYITLNSGILQIMSVTKGDMGLYRCTSTQMSQESYNSDVKYSAEAQLRVTDENVSLKVVESSGSVTVSVGSAAILECLVQGYHGKVQWQKDNTVFPVQYSSRVVLLGTNLQFLSTEFSDDGNYQCKAGHLLANIRLNVIKKPVIKKITKSQRKPAASWIYVKCDIDSYPKANITWLKDGKDIVFNVSTNYQKNQDDVITIVRSELHNSGYYQCYASNEAGYASAFTHVEVFLQAHTQCGPPIILKAESISSTQIDLVWQPPVQCSVVAYLIEIINGDSVEKLDDRVVQESRLTLQELVPFTNYIITISTFTRKGSGMKSELSIKTNEDVPRKAPLVTLEPMATSILVKWVELPKQDQNGVISMYKIFYRDMDNTVKIIDNISGRTASYVITDLEPETRYDVRMLAGTSVGFPKLLDAQWPWVSVMTESDDYVPAPDMTVAAINSTAVNIIWNYPDNVIVKLFHIQVVISGDVIVNSTLPATARSMIYEGLDGSAIYEVTLMVETADGLKAQSVKKYSVASVCMPPVPKNINVILRHSRSMIIEWQVPDTCVVVAKYVVRVSQYGASDNVTFITSEVNSVMLNNLSPFTKYEISVRADSEEIEGAYSSKIVEQTDVDDTSITSHPLIKSGSENQILGIIIGVSIGMVCIILCVVIFLQHRCINQCNRQVARTQAVHKHANGHVLSNDNGHAAVTRESPGGVYEMEPYTPLLDHLPENEHSDSKGGNGGNLILTPNGAKLNGFVPLKKNGLQNGSIPNGSLATFASDVYAHGDNDGEKTRWLITAMLGGKEPCAMSAVEEENFTASHEDLCSLDNIDQSCENVHCRSQGLEDGGDKRVCVSDKHSTGHRSSISKSDSMDMGDTFVYSDSGQCPQSASADVGVEHDTTGTALLSYNIPLSSHQSSLLSEDNCNNDGTFKNMFSLLPSQESDYSSSLPQGQNSTSHLSQAIDLNLVVRGHMRSDDTGDIGVVSGSTNVNNVS